MNTERFRVLAVDDDPDMLDLIKLSLEADFDVIALKDPGQALDYVDYIEPDIAVIDIMMPKITGYHMVEDIRANPQHQGIQIIFLSAKDSPHDIRYGYKLGANYYLTKPFMPERLHKTVEIVMAEGGLREPRRKSWTMKEVEARLHMKMPRLYETWQEFQAAREKIMGKEGLRLRRPLAHERHKKEDERRWEG